MSTRTRRLPLSERLVQVLSVIATVLAVLLLGLAIAALFDVGYEVTTYAVTSLVFLAILLVIGLEINRRRPRAASQFV